MSLLNSTAPAETAIPPLHDGDRLSRAEFERRYDAMPELKKAELIDGVVYMGSPVRTDMHATPHGNLVGWLAYYSWHTPGVRMADNGTVRLQGEDVVQPDAFLMIERPHGGRAKLAGDGHVNGGPELVAEVAASSASHDRTVKFPVYRDNGVHEYVLWRNEDQVIDWFILRDGQFAPLPLNEGIFKSEIFPGLWLDPKALIGYDGPRIAAVLQQGLGSPEHADFVIKLGEATPP